MYNKELSIKIAEQIILSDKHVRKAIANHFRSGGNVHEATDIFECLDLEEVNDENRKYFATENVYCEMAMSEEEGQKLSDKFWANVDSDPELGIIYLYPESAANLIEAWFVYLDEADDSFELAVTNGPIHY